MGPGSDRTSIHIRKGAQDTAKPRGTITRSHTEPGRSQEEGPRRSQPSTPGSQTAAQSCNGYISIVHSTVCGVCRRDKGKRRQWPGHSTVEGTTSRQGPGLIKPGSWRALPCISGESRAGGEGGGQGHRADRQAVEERSQQHIWS